MKCPRCKTSKTGKVATGEGKLEYILACFECSWQVAILELEAWLKRWKR